MSVLVNIIILGSCLLVLPSSLSLCGKYRINRLLILLLWQLDLSFELLLMLTLTISVKLVLLINCLFVFLEVHVIFLDKKIKINFIR